ncbi:methane monooxygenase/ammonia monooxygenase subunit A [Sinimarinibacterium sp. CAU 1509]|uniref:methane monooxygenase/ammonia monooxygenase subunit A n=1 Tax=Sinimarinibacterium sp. CAU 1509 TaxID=2562283 RepID=UPI0010ABD3A6|nr:methane monooxygenase/ammonia monooxygenase subunit A [Sinimarinibacterium sp. CAU 1509]TJY64783.1 methane monooxygenase/ammonia monooxygenase subunit A [Sinimarinibacterium sp. CAU 1509]
MSQELTVSAVRSTAEQHRVHVQVDLLAIPLVVLLFAAVFSFQFALLVGDWDYWIDWRDRRWWPLVTPLALTILPAVFSYFLWERLRLPLAATLTILALTAAAWVSRYLNFHLFANFPMNMVWPSAYIGLGLIVDCILLLTGSFFWTGLLGGFAFAVLLYPMNWPLLAPFQVPLELHGTMLTVSDLMGFEYVRTAIPEYVRIIEQSTLRTFGEAVTPLTAVFAGFLNIMNFWFWTWIGYLGSKALWIRKIV